MKIEYRDELGWMVLEVDHIAFMGEHVALFWDNSDEELNVPIEDILCIRDH